VELQKLIALAAELKLIHVKRVVSPEVEGVHKLEHLRFVQVLPLREEKTIVVGYPESVKDLLQRLL